MECLSTQNLGHRVWLWHRYSGIINCRKGEHRRYFGVCAGCLNNWHPTGLPVQDQQNDRIADRCWNSNMRGQCHCRSEEHTSELQSLMRISYAVFCLKKKTD